MPHINRIRVNNVKYNVGTQFYDDLCLRFQGKNSLYDLANGGGKSVLMLLLLQNLIPNCTLDDKQPIEKLFRGNTGSGVIHSLIEWDLDKADREEKGFRFMTTGFCARKKADRIREGEEEVSSSAIEYFNYCIFYNEFQDYDIRNLPLTNGNERISFKGLKELLKKLQNESNRKLRVKIFENAKGEYQRFIAAYGLYESQWNIIRGINKTEGHVRTYFETNYRTSRKVVEDLLIEEIIQKAYNLKSKTEKDTEELAQTLLEIREQMVELSVKKQQMACYDRQMQVLREFIGKFEPLMQTFEMREDAEKKTGVFYHALREKQERIGRLLEELKVSLKELDENKEETERKLKTLDLQEIEYALDEALYEKTQKEKEAEQLSETLAVLKDSIVEKESVNYFLNYKKAQSKAKTIEAEMASLKQGNKDLLASIEQMTAQKKAENEKTLKNLEEQKQEAESNLREYRKENEKTRENERHTDNQTAVLLSRITAGEEKLTRLKFEIRENIREFPLLLREQIPQKLAETKEELERVKADTVKMQRKTEEIRDEFQDARMSVKDTEHRIAEEDTRICELKKRTAQHEELKKQVAERQQAYQAADVHALAKELANRQNEAVIEISDTKKQLSEKKKYLSQLERGVVFSVSEETGKLRDDIYNRYKDGVLGMELLENAGKEEKERLLLKAPYLPYGIVVSGEVYEQLKQQPKSEVWQNVSAVIPIIDKRLLEAGTLAANQGMMLAGKEISYFLEKETLAKELEQTKSEIALCERRLKVLGEQKSIYAEDEKSVREYLEKYYIFQEEWEEQLAKAKRQQQNLQHQLREWNEKIQSLNLSLAQSKEQISQNETQIKAMGKQAEALQRLEELSVKCENKEAELEMLAAEKEDALQKQKRLQNRLADDEENILREETRIQLIDTQMLEIENCWKRYQIYYKEEIVPQTPITEDLEEKLTGAITAFENENKDVREKNETFQVVREQEKASAAELKKRKADIEKLQLLYEENQLSEVSEAELETYRERLQEEENIFQNCGQALGKLKELCAGYQSRAELLEEQIKNEFKVLKRVETGRLEIEDVREQLLKLQKQYQSEYLSLLQEQKSKEKASEKLQNMTERVLWIASEYQIASLETTEAAGFVISDFQETEKIILQSWQKMRERKEAARANFRKAKAYCEEQMKNLQAASFAMQMKEQIQIPETAAQAKKTIQNLEEACEMIRMGKERIESGLQDIEKIKNSFENQCLQRCNNIRVELDKFPKLSSIMMDGQLTQIVKLRIPYVKEEQQQMCIGNYLTQVIDNLGRYETEQEKKKYLMQELSMKRLFSAIVTDMNRISLELYKRERVKEQSRHLKYEEAVGSTGQSQGIYIQFLIAVINYIASIHSYHSGHESLKKVIFIDNPFGAAKDTYIWEPIFTMLAANRVQLIVPTRGATPAIIGKFDVNYLLGQKMVGTKQQTVVVDYRSKIETEEAEYVKLDYEQASLF